MLGSKACTAMANGNGLKRDERRPGGRGHCAQVDIMLLGAREDTEMEPSEVTEVSAWATHQDSGTFGR